MRPYRPRMLRRPTVRAGGLLPRLMVLFHRRRLVMMILASGHAHNLTLGNEVRDLFHPNGGGAPVEAWAFVEMIRGDDQITQLRRHLDHEPARAPKRFHRHGHFPPLRPMSSLRETGDSAIG